MVRSVGFAPTHPFGYSILSAARLLLRHERLVRKIGLEPIRPKAPASKAGMASNYIISAWYPKKKSNLHTETFEVSRFAICVFGLTGDAY